jgi:hypothetical protein
MRHNGNNGSKGGDKKYNLSFIICSQETKVVLKTERTKEMHGNRLILANTNGGNECTIRLHTLIAEKAAFTS